MATTRLIPLHTGKGRNFGKAIRNVIGYVSNPKKTHQGELVTGFGCNPETADGEFLLMKREYIAQTGRLRGKDDVIAYHLRQSFVPGEITPEEANRIGCELASRFTHGQHAYVVATHEDRRHVQVDEEKRKLDVQKNALAPYLDCANPLSPQYHWERIRSILRDSSQWAKRDSKIRGNQIKSAVTEVVMREIYGMMVRDSLDQLETDFSEKSKLLKSATTPNPAYTFPVKTQKRRILRIKYLLCWLKNWTNQCLLNENSLFFL